VHPASTGLLWPGPWPVCGPGHLAAEADGLSKRATSIMCRWTGSALSIDGGTPVASGCDGEESPCGGYAFELVFAAVVEVRTRAGHEIDDGT
jgi:hypothetical protein